MFISPFYTNNIYDKAHDNNADGGPNQEPEQEVYA